MCDLVKQDIIGKQTLKILEYEISFPTNAAAYRKFSLLDSIHLTQHENGGSIS